MQPADPYAARPRSMDEAEWRARVDLAACYRLAARNGWDDLVYTHASLRLPGCEAFLINPFGLAFDEIRASQLLVIDLEGRVLRGQGVANPGGFAIHSAVHRARHDARCVIHLHTRAGIAVSALACGLLPLSQHALRFWGAIGRHTYAGLDFDAAEQTRLVQALGGHPALLLDNHGSLTCGRTVAEAYVLMHTLETACEIQLAAMAASAQLVLPTEEVAARTHVQLTAGATPEGVLEWPALLRRLMRTEAEFAC